MLYTDQKQNPEDKTCYHDEKTIWNGNVFCLACGEDLGRAEKEFSVQVITDDTDSICAWCHFTCDEEGNRNRYLTDIEYAALSANDQQSHGICNQCKEDMLAGVNAKADDLNYEHNEINL